MDIIETLRGRLKAAGRARWREIAAAVGVSPKLPEKIVYGLRENPGVRTIQPLLDFFDAEDAARCVVTTAAGAKPVDANRSMSGNKQ